MKLTPNQKELLACIKDKEIRKEVKKEFKKKFDFYRTRWKLLDEMDFKPDDFMSKNPDVVGYLGDHPLKDILFKEEVEGKLNFDLPKKEDNMFSWYKGEFANENPKQFTLEDMKNAFYNGSSATLIKILSEKRYKDFEDYIDSLKKPVN